MDTNSIAILITMILGFITVVFSVHGMIRSDMNRRFDDQKEEMNHRFDNQKEETSRRFDEQKEETNRRFDGFDKSLLKFNSDVNRRFDEQNEEIDRRFAEQKEEIGEVKFGLNAMRNRLDTFIDNFALRVITEGRRPSRKSV